ncbi:MAG: PAS domain S-box protein, partial [Deltaproteobacteria bacterium]|nr:PAS domain S-box protein [Deltaproteobacteria bacterium]
MNVFWLGKKTKPPPGIDFQIAGGINEVVENSLVFVDDLRFLNGNSHNYSRVYLVTDKPASQKLSNKVDGVIPRDIRVITAIKDLFSEICQSTQTSDDLLTTLNEKELVIREKQDILLRDSRRYKAMIKHASDLIFILGAKGRIMFCNETFKQYIDMDKDALIGKSFINFVFEEDRQNLECFIQESFRKGIPSKIETRLNLSGGNTGIFSLMS